MLYLNAKEDETRIPSNQMKNGKLSANCIISSQKKMLLELFAVGVSLLHSQLCTRVNYVLHKIASPRFSSVGHKFFKFQINTISPKQIPIFSSPTNATARGHLLKARKRVFRA